MTAEAAGAEGRSSCWAAERGGEVASAAVVDWSLVWRWVAVVCHYHSLAWISHNQTDF